MAILLNFNPLILSPFPPKGAREVVDSPSFPALGGRMSVKDRKGAAFKYGLMQLAQLQQHSHLVLWISREGIS
jgi:hypothetical protein